MSLSGTSEYLQPDIFVNDRCGTYPAEKNCSCSWKMVTLCLDSVGGNPDMHESEKEPEPVSKNDCGVCKIGQAGFMIACETCDGWFHGRCVNISSEEADKIDKYYCPICVSNNPNLRTSHQKSLKISIKKTALLETKKTRLAKVPAGSSEKKPMPEIRPKSTNHSACPHPGSILSLIAASPNEEPTTAVPPVFPATIVPRDSRSVSTTSVSTTTSIPSSSKTAVPRASRSKSKDTGLAFGHNTVAETGPADAEPKPVEPNVAASVFVKPQIADGATRSEPLPAELPIPADVQTVDEHARPIVDPGTGTNSPLSVAVDMQSENDFDPGAPVALMVVDENFLNQPWVNSYLTTILAHNPRVSREDFISCLRNPLLQKDAKEVMDCVFHFEA